MTATYCQTRDVQRVLQNRYDFSSSTYPTEDDVTSFIEEAQDEIDQRTQHAWREKTVTNEYYDIPLNSNPDADYTTGVEIHMRHRKIRSLTKLEIWDGSSWVDWVATKTEGRANDYWYDDEQGVLFVKYYNVYYSRKAVRLSYTYGETTVPKDIQRCCAMMSAINLLRNDDQSAMLSETGDPTRQPYDARIAGMMGEIKRIIRNRSEISVI